MKGPHRTDMQQTLEYYDSRMEQQRLRALERKFQQFERQGIAEQAALAEHPVVHFVKSLPVEDPRYPAIEYLRLAQQVGRDVWDVFNEVQEGKREFSGRNGETIRFDPIPHEFVTWSMPAHDLRRPEDKKAASYAPPPAPWSTPCAPTTRSTTSRARGDTAGRCTALAA